MRYISWHWSMKIPGNGERRRLNGTLERWILTIRRKNNPTYPVCDFLKKIISIYIHNTTYVYCIFWMYIYTQREAGGIFNTQYCFTSLIFEGIVWFTWALTVAGFNVSCECAPNSTPTLQPTSPTIQWDSLPASGFPNNSCAHVQPQLLRFPFREKALIVKEAESGY